MMSRLEVGNQRESRVGRVFLRYDVGEATGKGHLRSAWDNKQGVTSLAKSRGLGPSFEAEGTARAVGAEREEPGVTAAQTGRVAAAERVAKGREELGSLCQEHSGRLYELFPPPTVFGLTVT